MLIRLLLLFALTTVLNGKSKVEKLCKFKREVHYADCRTEGKNKESCKLEADVAHHRCHLERAELQQKINSIRSKAKSSISGKVLEKLLAIGTKAF